MEPINKQFWWQVFERDDELIETMEADLLEFAEVVANYEKQLRKEAM